MKISLGWRFVIAAALATLGLIITSLVELAFTSFFTLLLLVVALGLSLFGAWLIFTGTNKRLAIGWTLLAVSLVALVGLFYELTTDLSDPLFLRIVILFLLYSFLVGVLRREYWRQKRLTAQAKSTKTLPSAVLIINPKSGNGRAIKARIPQKAKKLGITTIITKKGDSIEGLARQAVSNGAKILGVSGGDGTLGAVAKVAIEEDLPLVVLPGGTRCHFARDVGFDPKEIADALASFHGIERRVDVGSINGRIFLNNASFGLYADVVDKPDYRNHKIRTTREVLRSLLNGDTPYYPLSFTDDKEKKHRHAAQILVGVNAYETVNIFELGRRHAMDRGVLQITAVTKLTDELIGQMMETIVLGQSFEDSNTGHVEQWEATKFSVNSKSKKLVVGVDGEREEYVTPVKLEILPGALRLMVPPEGMRKRPDNPLSPKTLKKLWDTLISH